MKYRVEKDAYGELQVPLEAYYGGGAQRSKDLFALTKHGLNRQMIKAFASIKKAAAKANCDCGYISKEVENAISLSCDEILNGRLHGQFVVDIVHGGSGVAMNINANEVIANRANEILGGEKGKYDLVHPENHVNLNQNDLSTVIMACKFSTVRLIKKLITESKKLINAYDDKINEYNLETVNKALYEEIQNFADVHERDTKRVNTTLPMLLEVNVTIPNQIHDTDPFTKKYIKYLTQFVGENIKQTKNPLDFDRHLDDVAIASSSLKTMISNLSKVANDIFLLSKQGKITLDAAAIQTIEVVKQMSFYVMGNDLTIQRAVESGELENNIFIPIIFACMFELENLVRRTIRTYREHVIEPLIINSSN